MKVTTTTRREPTPEASCFPAPPGHPVRGGLVFVLLTVLLLALLASGCGAARAGRFEAFAKAGQDYSVVRNRFLQQSLETSIARDTMDFRLEADDEEDATERVRLLNEHDTGMRHRMEIFHDLERHAQVRDLYFAALAELAGSKGTERAGQAANAFAGQIGTMTGVLAQRTLLGRPINQLLGQATSAAVGSFRNRALELHLQTHAATIENELALEEGLLEFLAKVMTEDLRALHQARRRERVIQPLMRDEPLPPSWSGAREQLLVAEFDLGKLQAAKQAATGLRQAYRQLVEGKDQDTGVSAVHLEFAVQRLAGAVASIRAARQSAE